MGNSPREFFFPSSCSFSFLIFYYNRINFIMEKKSLGVTLIFKRVENEHKDCVGESQQKFSELFFVAAVNIQVRSEFQKLRCLGNGHHGIGIRSLEKSAHSIIQNSRTTISCLLFSTVHTGGLNLESFSLNLCSGANIKCPPDAKRKESLVFMEIIHVFFFDVPLKLICIWSWLNLAKR